VVMGANGSGKSRLGAWLESHRDYVAKSHRVAAQRSLVFPPDITPTGLDRAEQILYYGREQGSEHGKSSFRWGNHPATSPLNDFMALTQVLFSEEFDLYERWKETHRICPDATPPLTRMDRTKQIWEEILPYRSLVIRSGNVRVSCQDNPGTQYPSTELSDGERVIFYLVGQVLCAPRNARH
jgi:hypothetical protein